MESNDRVMIGQLGKRWVDGAIKSLSGKTGVIIKRHDGSGYFLDGSIYLVQLDETPAPWCDFQRPSCQWWFKADELTKI